MIKVNQCYAIEKVKYRVIYANENENIVALIVIGEEENEKESARPSCIQYEKFSKDVDNKIFRKIKDPYEDISYYPAEKDLSEMEKQKRDTNFNMIIDSWLYRKDELLNKRKRTKVFQEIADMSDVNVRTVDRIFSRFWQRGMNRNAVLPDYRFSGGKGTDKNLKRKSGRKYEQEIGGKRILGKILDEVDKYNIKVAYYTNYRQGHEPTLSSSYSWMLGKSYKDKVIINDRGMVWQHFFVQKL